MRGVLIYAHFLFTFHGVIGGNDTRRRTGIITEATSQNFGICCDVFGKRHGVYIGHYGVIFHAEYGVKSAADSLARKIAEAGDGGGYLLYGDAKVRKEEAPALKKEIRNILAAGDKMPIKSRVYFYLYLCAPRLLRKMLQAQNVE